MNHPRLFEVAVNVPVQIIPPPHHHTLFFFFSLAHSRKHRWLVQKWKLSTLCTCAPDESSGRGWNWCKERNSTATGYVRRQTDESVRRFAISACRFQLNRIKPTWAVFAAGFVILFPGFLTCTRVLVATSRHSSGSGCTWLLLFREWTLSIQFKRFLNKELPHSVQ